MFTRKPSSIHSQYYLSSELDDVHCVRILYRLRKHTRILSDDWSILRDPFLEASATAATELSTVLNNTEDSILNTKERDAAGAAAEHQTCTRESLPIAANKSPTV